MQEHTLLELWNQNNRSAKNLYVKSKTNKTPRYKVLLIQENKNRAILMNRGKGFFGYFKKYYQIFTINNKRWTKL